jgi:GAF domain-containing protein
VGARDLERQLHEAREQQDATSAILRAIGTGQTNLQSVLEAIVASAAKLCDSTDAQIFRVDGSVLRLAASYGPLPKISPDETRPIDRGSVNGRAVVDRCTVHLHDLAAANDREWREAKAFQRRFGHRTILATPLMRDGIPLGAITIRRMEVRPFSERQVALLETFAAQAAIAIENVRQFNETKEALERQTATSEILRVISTSPTTIQPVFDTIAQSALNLCRASSAGVFMREGELIHVSALASVTPQGAEAIRNAFPRAPGRESAACRAVLTGRITAIPDVLADADYRIGEAALASGFRSTVSVPLLHQGRIIGAIGVGRPAPGPFSERQIAMLETFATQATIAIENVRLFDELGARNRDLTEALEQQTATSEILRVISKSPTDTQPVFDIIGERAEKLCNAEVSIVSIVDGDLIRLVALHGENPEGTVLVRRRFPMSLTAETVTARTVRSRAVVHVEDLLADRTYETKDEARRAGFRSGLGVPMLRDGRVIGVIFVSRRTPGRFASSQVELLKTFADQAVIAVENVRLFTELGQRNRDVTEALEQQTATSEILRAISGSPTDVEPVFDTIAERAAKLCDAEVGVVSRLDGESIEVAALYGVTAEGVEAIGRAFPMRLSANTVTARTVRARGVVHVADIMDDPTYETKEVARAGHFRACLGVPMLAEGQVIGVVFVSRALPGLFSERQVELLQTFAAQAVIAVRNVQLFRQLQARTQQLTRSVAELEALGDVGQAVSSTLDLETVLKTIVTRAVELTGMDGGSIYEYDEAREELHLQTADRVPDALLEVLRAAPMRKGEGAIGRLAVTPEPVELPDIADAAAYQSHVRDLLLRLGWRSLLAVPLLREDHLLGGLVVNRNRPGSFAPEVIALLQTFASQSSLAIQNARLFREIEQKSRELEAASRHKSEFLANMSHELRTPLNAIIGFSEVLAERMFGEINDKQAEYLGDILESGKHLLSLINAILDLSKIAAGRMELQPSEFDLPAAIENTLVLVRERAQRRGIALGRVVDRRLGMIDADERKIKQVLLNLLSNALKFTQEGGRVDVRAELADDVAEISVTDTGIGIAPGDLASVFEEFRQVGTAARKVEGTGLGLAISRKFVELHGGTIGVQSRVGEGSTFTFTLPVQRV